jgi:hypothetical protein
MNYSLYTSERLAAEYRRDALRLADQERLARLARGQRGIPAWRMHLAAGLRSLANSLAAQPPDASHRRYSGSAQSHVVTG